MVMNIFTSVPNRNLLRYPPSDPKELQLWQERIPSAGMNSVLDRVDIPDNQFFLIKNAYSRDDKLIRRNGSSLITPTKPDTDPIVSLYVFEDLDEEFHFYRATENKLYERESSWTEITAAGSPVSGGPTDRYIFTSFNGRLFFTNGVDDVMEVAVAVQTYDSLGIGAWKYFAGFHERGVVAYNLDITNGLHIAWTGQGNLGEIDPVTDPSAGEFFLTEAEADYQDHITGLFGFAKELIIPRERSIWVANKLPSATNPFQFSPVATGGVGADIPHAISAIPNGIVFYNFAQNQVYVFSTLSGGVIPIGDAVRDSLYASIDNKAKVWSIYSNITAEYHLCIAHDSTSTVQDWIFNFRSKAWTVCEYQNLTALALGLLGAGSLKVADLVGKVSGLMGKVEDLTLAAESIKEEMFLGFSNGDVSIEDVSVDVDETTDGEVEIETELISKTHEIVVRNVSVNQLSLLIIPKEVCEITISFSKDNGINFTDYKTVSFSSSDIGKRHRITCIKNVKTDYYTWKLLCTSGKFSLVAWEIDSFAGGRHKATKAAV